MEAVDNGYLFLSFDEERKFISVDENGAFCTVVDLCGSNSFELSGVEWDTGLTGPVSTYELSDGSQVDLEISTCGQIGGYMLYRLDNGIDAILLPYLSISLDVDGILSFSTSLDINGVYPGGLISGQDWGTSSFSFGFFDLLLADNFAEVDCDGFICDPPIIDIIEFGGVGNPIILEMTGFSDEGVFYDLRLQGMLE